MQTKTKKKQQYKSKALYRAASSYNGAMKILRFVERCEGTENISNVVASQEALTLMEYRIGGF